MRVLFFHERPVVSGSTISLALSIEALGSEIEPWVVTPPGPAAELLGGSARVVTAPSAGLLHVWSGSYSGARWSLLPAHAAALPRHLIAARAVLREVRPDVVHVNDSPQLPVALAARRLGFPVVVHLRAALPGVAGRRSEIVRRAVARADVAVAINEDVAESFSWPPNLAVVPNPVRIPQGAGEERAAAAKEELGLPSQRPVVGFVGHLLRAKGCLELLEAVARLVDSGVDLGVALVGAPTRPREWHRSARGQVMGALADRRDMEGELHLATARLGLRDRVSLLAWRDDMSTAYTAFDVLCAPSQGPELSRPVLEAQAHGRAVVAVSRTGGGIVEHGVNGLLVDRADPDRLAQAIGRLVGDPALRARLGAEGRAHAEREYAPEVVAERLKGVYARATGTPLERPAAVAA